MTVGARGQQRELKQRDRLLLVLLLLRLLLQSARPRAPPLLPRTARHPHQRVQTLLLHLLLFLLLLLLLPLPLLRLPRLHLFRLLLGDREPLLLLVVWFYAEQTQEYRRPVLPLLFLRKYVRKSNRVHVSIYERYIQTLAGKHQQAQVQAKDAHTHRRA